MKTMKFKRDERVQFTDKELGLLKGKIHDFLRGKWIVILNKPIGKTVSLAVDEKELISMPF